MLRPQSVAMNGYVMRLMIVSKTTMHDFDERNRIESGIMAHSIVNEASNMIRTLRMMMMMTKLERE